MLDIQKLINKKMKQQNSQTAIYENDYSPKAKRGELALDLETISDKLTIQFEQQELDDFRFVLAASIAAKEVLKARRTSR